MDTPLIESAKQALSEELSNLEYSQKVLRHRISGKRKFSSLDVKKHLAEIIVHNETDRAKDKISSDENIHARNLNKKIGNIRASTVENYVFAISEEQKIGKMLFADYENNIERNRQKRYWLVSTKRVAEILDEQAEHINKTLFPDSNVADLDKENWSDYLKKLDSALIYYTELNKKMSETLKEDRKFRDDLWRANAARWGIAISITVAAIGQSDDAASNIGWLWGKISTYFSEPQSDNAGLK